MTEESVALNSVSALISALALSVSAFTLWLTFLHRGTIKMTKPRQIYLGPDGPNHQGKPKVVLRTILFSTAKRGRFVEGMHVSIFKSEMKQNFPVWVLGNESLALGSGLFVGENGHSAHHHFLTLDDAVDFRFTAGRYRLQVFAKLLGAKSNLLLFTQELQITESQAAQLAEPNAGIYFDWGPDASEYVARVSRKEPGVGPEDFLELLQSLKMGALHAKPPTDSDS
jgi:hypothetical protein